MKMKQTPEFYAAAKAKLPALMAEGLTNLDMSNRLGIGETTVRSWKREIRKGQPKPICPKEREKLRAAARKLYTRGHTQTVIADRLGVNRQDIHNWLQDRTVEKRNEHRCIHASGHPWGFHERLAAKGWGYA